MECQSAAELGPGSKHAPPGDPIVDVQGQQHRRRVGVAQAIAAASPAAAAAPTREAI